MLAKLYWFPFSHPSQAVRQMLELKGVPYKLVTVLPGNQQIHLRVIGFGGGTVPAIKLDGQRVQGSRRISRALDELVREPPLFSDDPDRRREIEEVERWGDEVVQPMSRRIMRWGLVHNVDLRRWLAEQSGMPAPGVAARLSGPTSVAYARLASSTEDNARRDVAALPRMLDDVDRLLAHGTLSTTSPNAATYQVLCTVRALAGFEDFQPVVDGRASTAAAHELFPEDFAPSLVPAFVPRDWL